eukprot:403337848
MENNNKFTTIVDIVSDDAALASYSADVPLSDANVASKISNPFQQLGIPLTSVMTLVEKYDYFLLDCDGVIWSGSKVIDQSALVLNYLHFLGKKIFFITNSSGKTRQQYLETFHRIGYQSCTAEQIYGSAYTTANYIKEKYPEVKKCRVVGMNSIRKELEFQGIESEGGEDMPIFESNQDVEKKVMNIKDFENYSLDREVSAVVVGLDTKFTYSKLAIASMYIQTHGAKFIATNGDAYDNVNGRKMPGAGAMVNSILYTLDQADKSRESFKPEIIGKPNPYVIELIMKENQICDKSKMIMIGDRPDTDILLGTNAGIDKCLTLTGVVESLDEIPSWIEKNPGCKPTYVMQSFGLLVAMVQQSMMNMKLI